MRKLRNSVKMVSFLLVGVVLFVLWNVMFIVQAGIGFHYQPVLIPLYIIPLFTFTVVTCYLTFKMFAPKMSAPKKKKYSYIGAEAAVAFSLLFQLFGMPLGKEIIKFDDPKFSHLKAIEITDTFGERAVLAVFSYSKLIPFGSIDREIINLGFDWTVNAIVTSKINKAFYSEQESTCRKYNDISKCREELLSKHQNSRSPANQKYKSLSTLKNLQGKSLLLPLLTSY